jgi:pyruvate dehydrogenase (quinone)
MNGKRRLLGSFTHGSMANALAHAGPALLEVLVNRQELSMPPTITLEQALGFSLYMIRAVLSGRAMK